MHRHFAKLISPFSDACTENYVNRVRRLDKVANCAKNCGYKVLRAFCQPSLSLTLSLSASLFVLHYVSGSLTLSIGRAVSPAGCQIVIYTTTEA